MARRVGLKLSMTEGFTPKPRFVFPSALALGVQGTHEVVEIELSDPISPREVLDRLVGDHQPGMSIISVKRLPEGFGKAQLAFAEYHISGPDGLGGHDDSTDRDSWQGVDWSRVGESIDRLMASESVTIERKKKTVTMRVADQIHSLRIVGECVEQKHDTLSNPAIFLSLIASQAASLRPDDVLTLLGLDDWISGGATITRTNVLLDNEFHTGDLDEIATPTQSPPASMRLTQICNRIKPAQHP